MNIILQLVDSNVMPLKLHPKITSILHIYYFFFFFLGQLDLSPHCSGHGTFSMDVCSCVCDEGWMGRNCSEPQCLGNCSGQGVCVEGMCVCDSDFSGENCSEPRCPGDCSGQGVCIAGGCVCEEDYSGDDCSMNRCLNDCSDQRLCVNGTCQCKLGFLGKDCSRISCANNCSNKGECKAGFCVCQEGYMGEECASGRCCFSRFLHRCVPEKLFFLKKKQTKMLQIAIHPNTFSYFSMKMHSNFQRPHTKANCGTNWSMCAVTGVLIIRTKPFYFTSVQIVQ